MASTALQAFRRTVTVDWPAHAKEGARQHLLTVARAGHARIMADTRAKTGSDPAWDAYANTPGRPIEQVVIPGPIVFRYRHIGNIVEFTLDALVRASPVRTGRYADSHLVFVNGAQAGPKAKIGPRDRVMIANPVPYARRLEIGKTESGRDFVIQVPNRIYERVAKKTLVPKFGKVAKITFGYVQLASAYATKGKLRGSYQTMGPKGLIRRNRRQKPGSRVMAPAIFIDPLE